ncbi:TIM barrel protein [Akkermansiaceae bacterium]|nr:TIM barrel protein [bacterium]MDC1405069.1 TIM barrel protein [Akkermansiaceae bacterium]
MNRRKSLATLTTGTAALFSSLGSQIQAAEKAAGPNAKFKHSVCHWCFGKIPLNEFAAGVKKIGIESVEILFPEQWAVVAKHGLTCAMGRLKTPGGVGNIPNSFNRKENHDALYKAYEEGIPMAAKAGNVPQIIAFSGNRAGMDDEEGLKNCAEGLKRIMPIAEKHNITISMELLNSKVNHADYMCDRTQWGVDLVNAVGSDRFKLLYDIYHMQIMEGDCIATFTKNIDAISHFHTAGVPGRNEIGDNQELNYRGISKALVAAGYTGYLGQEFVPKNDPMTSLKEAVDICTV